MSIQTIFSGIQPANSLHIGNYLCSIKQWAKSQETADECFFCVVDLHALTAPYGNESIYDNSIKTTAYYLASGIDPKKSNIFIQSQVSEHCSLYWLLGCFTNMGSLNRMTQYKSKVHKGFSSNLGIYSYPILMAADILLYDTNFVPVGHDQMQHLELAKEIAISMNHNQNCDFIIPEGLISKQINRIMSLRNGQEKMSKSDASDYSRINLSDDNDTIIKKFKKAKSDSHEYISYDVKERPECSNLLSIYAAFTDSTPEKVSQQFTGKNFSHLKKELSDIVVAEIEPLREEANRILQNDQSYIKQILSDGQTIAKQKAAKTLARIQQKLSIAKL